MGTRVRDTLHVLRAVGARGLASAAWRRAAAGGRELSRELRERIAPLAPASAPWFVGALVAAPSPLAADEDRRRLAPLGARAAEAILARALDALSGREAAPSDYADDRRTMWEGARRHRLVWIAAGARMSDDLRLAWEREAVAALAEPSVRDDPLEVALRAWNLWVALSLVGPARLSERAVAAIAAALVEDARYLVRNLDDRGLVVGSHLVGELVGLYACGVALRGAGAEPALWRAQARAGLEREARRQILADGSGAEGSTGYARFVAELWLAAAATARAAREPLSADAAGQRMLAALVAQMAPDGRDVGIGDDDGSRVLPPGAREPRDLTALAACLRERRLAGLGWSEEAAWLLGAAGHAAWTATAPAPWPEAVHAGAFGLALARRGGLGGDMVALRAGDHGQMGAGGHAHNDPLSVAVWLDGDAVVVDPGTGVYSARRAVRDRFRGVAAHATLCVDGQEPSPILPTRPFALPDGAGARVLSVRDRDGIWRCVAAHEGYRRLGVRHVREVIFDRRARAVCIRDRLEGSGAHEIALSFPLARPEQAGWIGGDAEGLLRRLDPTLRSPSYGKVGPGMTLRRIGRVQLPYSCETIIATRA